MIRPEKENKTGVFLQRPYCFNKRSQQETRDLKGVKNLPVRHYDMNVKTVMDLIYVKTVMDLIYIIISRFCHIV